MKLKKNEVLVLRACTDDMKSYGGFVWPEKGYVEALDWTENYKCGNGLHGLLWATGNVSYLSGGKWFVVKVDTTKGFCHGKGDMTDKCKFRCGEVVYCGERAEAIALIQQYAPHDSVINFSSQKSGDYSTQTAGYRSTQTAGNRSTQTAGVGTVQIIRYYKNGWEVKTRIITEKEAGKTYRFENEDWILLK